MRKKLGLLSLLFLMSCTEQKKTDTLVFATSADYPPFEFKDDGQITGLDIELSHAISQEISKKIEFKDMQFNTLFESLKNGSVDAVIATIVATEERAKLFDFSDVYYKETLALITKTNDQYNEEKLKGQKIAYQLGAMNIENWIKQNIKEAELIAINHANQAIESLKAGHVSAVVVDGAQAQSFITNNSGLEYKIIPSENPGYVIATKKGSALKEEINTALAKLKANGKLEEIITKWMKG